MLNIEKEKLRERVLTLLRNQKEEKRLEKSLNIANKLFHLQEFKKANTILFYAAFDGEVETYQMINHSQKLGKQVGLPKSNKATKEIIPMLMQHSILECEAGSYGIKEPLINKSTPLAVEDIDLVVVPGVVFDRFNNRCGRGGGFYDRFLGKVPKDTPKIGVAFDFQMIDDLSFTEAHDIPVDQVLVG